MTTKVLSQSDFKHLHDKSHIIPEKIRAGLKKLGPKGWQYQPDFIKTCEIGNPADFGHHSAQFEADHCVLIGGSKGKKAWAGSKELADRLRAML